MVERNTAISEKEIFLENLKGIIEILNRHVVDYRLVGGFAVDAYLGGEFNFRRKSGAVRDVDMVILSTDKESLDVVREEIKTAEALTKHGDLFPKVGLNQAYERGTSFKRCTLGMPAVLSGFMVDNGKYFLVFNDLKEEIPSSVIARVFVNIEGIEIPSLSPETILHLYLVRGGSLKAKDLHKLFELCRKIANFPTIGLSHQDFLVFHRFARQMRMRYPLLVNGFKVFFILDQLIGNRISNADRFVYGIWRPIQHSGKVK